MVAPFCALHAPGQPCFGYRPFVSFGKPEISLAKLTDRALITATRLSELTFPSFRKSHGGGVDLQADSLFFFFFFLNVAELIFHARHNF